MSSTTSVRPYKPYQRLNTNGSRVLQEFFDNVSQNPTMAQKKELLLVVNAIPGNDKFTLHKLKGWFKRKRQCTRTSPYCGVINFKPVISKVDSPSDPPTSNPDIMKTCAKLLRLPLPQLQVMLNQPKQLITSTTTLRQLETSQPPETPIRLETEHPSIHDTRRTNILIDIGNDMEAADGRELPASLSRAEFNALFAPYELKMRAIIENNTF